MLIIDPPTGWRYGFPRPLDIKEDQSLEEWLVEKGYPKKDVEWAAKHCRYWNSTDDG